MATGHLHITNGRFYVTVEVAAQLCGVTVQSLYRWRTMPDPPPFHEKYGYPLKKLGEWIRKEQIYKKGKGGSFPWKPDMSRFGEDTSEPSLPGLTPKRKESQKDRLDRLRGDKMEMDLQIKAGKLVVAEDVEIAMASMVSRVKTRLLSIATQLAPIITGKSDQFDVQADIEESVRDALQELSSDWRDTEESENTEEEFDFEGES
jgi:hypothetical protein